MTDGQTLFAVFALLYLAECLRLVSSTTWMAAGPGGRGWTVIRPWSRLHVGGGSPLLLSALPPMQAHVTALPWLFVPEQDFLKVRLGDGMTARIAWDRLGPRVEGAGLHLDPGTHLRMPSEALAEIWRRRLAEWRELPADERRAAFLKHARASLDTKAAARTAADAAQRTRMPRIIATTHFIWCFGVISAAYHRFGDSLVVLASAGVLFLLQIAQAWLFLRATLPVKSLIPHRRWRALGIALLPQLAMRAADAISLAGNEEPPHPLAWRGLLGGESWLRHARRFWRETRYHPGWTRDDSLTPEAEALKAFFCLEGVVGSDYDPPPGAKLPVCPRCNAEYQTGITLCKDCGGVELRTPMPGSV